MDTSSLVVDQARQLTAAGQHAEVVNYLAARQGSELVESASLALLYGTAQARVGRHAEGLRWLDTALEQARKGGERGVESRALNARGAMSLVSGRLDEAADYCTRALMLASLDGDSATVGRCSNNLGIVSNLRGRHAEAIGSWEIARAAFERAGWRQGVGECHHNLGITYREQGAFDRALAEANRAVAEAEASGDHTLWALTLRGRAEIHVSRGELQLARRELDQVRDLRVGVPDSADEAEDARVVASLLVAGWAGWTWASSGPWSRSCGRACWAIGPWKCGRSTSPEPSPWNAGASTRRRISSRARKSRRCRTTTWPPWAGAPTTSASSPTCRGTTLGRSAPTPARSRRTSRPAFTGGSPSRGTISGSPIGSRGGWTTRSRPPTRRCGTPSG